MNEPSDIQVIIHATVSKIVKINGAFEVEKGKFSVDCDFDKPADLIIFLRECADSIERANE